MQQNQIEYIRQALNGVSDLDAAHLLAMMGFDEISISQIIPSYGSIPHDIDAPISNAHMKLLKKVYQNLRSLSQNKAEVEK